MKRSVFIPVIVFLGMLFPINGCADVEEPVFDPDNNPKDKLLLDAADKLNAKGLKLMEDGKLEEAAVKFGAAASKIPNYKDAHFNHGVTLQQTGKHKEAVAAFDKVLEIDDKFIEAWMRRGDALKDMNKFKEAEESYRKAMRIDPKNPESCIKLVSLFENRNMHEKANETAMECAGKMPDDIRLNLQIGVGLLGQKNEKALPVFLKIQEKKPDTEKLDEYLALAYYYAAKPDEARKYAKKVLSENADNFNANMVMMWIEINGENWEEAIIFNNEVVKSQPEDLDALIAKARIAAATMDGEKLKAAFDSFKESDPGNPDLISSLAYQAQKKDSELGDAYFKEALEIYRKRGDEERVKRLEAILHQEKTPMKATKKPR